MKPENRVDYNELCPTCKDLGQEQPLFFDMDKVVIGCELGHTFEELPSQTATRAGQSVEQIATEVSGVEQPASEGGVVNTLEESVSQEEGAQRLAEIAQEMTPEPVKEPEPPAPQVRKANLLEDYPDGLTVDSKGVASGVPAVRANQAIALPNGDLMLGVVIPETWRSSVEAEAQAQLKSPAAYFADWMTSDEVRSAIIDALGTYWTANYAQTV